MISLLKFLFSFAISFFILSIPIGNNTLFRVIDRHTAQYTDPIYALAKEKANAGIRQGKEFAKKLFSNSTPTEKASDSVKHQYSGARKDYQEFKLPADSYTVEEQELIRKLTSKK